MKYVFLLIYSFSCMSIHGQADTIQEVFFEDIEKKLLEPGDENQCLNYDFKIVDAAYFNQNSTKKDLSTSHYDNEFELKPADGKSIIKFVCKQRIPETCYYYAGFSQNAEVYIITKCREVCET